MMILHQRLLANDTGLPHGTGIFKIIHDPRGADHEGPVGERGLFAAVITRQMLDAVGEIGVHPNRIDQVLACLDGWLRSPDGRIIASLAGCELNDFMIDRLLAHVRSRSAHVVEHSYRARVARHSIATQDPKEAAPLKVPHKKPFSPWGDDVTDVLRLREKQRPRRRRGARKAVQ